MDAVWSVAGYFLCYGCAGSLVYGLYVRWVSVRGSRKSEASSRAEVIDRLERELFPELFPELESTYISKPGLVKVRPLPSVPDDGRVYAS